MICSFSSFRPTFTGDRPVLRVPTPRRNVIRLCVCIYIYEFIRAGHRILDLLVDVSEQLART